jgi:hypothetical protein
MIARANLDLASIEEVEELIGRLEFPTRRNVLRIGRPLTGAAPFQAILTSNQVRGLVSGNGNQQGP